MNINQCFDETLKKYRITGAVLSRKVGVSPSHISQFRNGKGGSVAHTTLEEMLNAMEEIAPGSRLYFCFLLSGQDPNMLPEKQRLIAGELLGVSSQTTLKSVLPLLVNASREEKAMVLRLIADCWFKSDTVNEQSSELLAV